jgi:mono/diheme cytochrome c family protein
LAGRITSAFSVLLALASSSFAAPADPPVTFAKDVASIFQEKCETCHRPGQGAPMNLQTYKDARPWARSIRERVATRNMPPWHLDKSIGIQHYANDRSLSEKQIRTIVQWVDEGAPLGDPKDLPRPKVWPDDSWQYAKIIGQEPDIVVTSAPVTIPAVGQDEWWKPVSDVPIAEERWIRAVEMRPATLAGRRITHHAVTMLVQYEPSSPEGMGGDAGLLMEWSIGKSYDAFRSDTGKLLLPGAKVRWDIHYHSAGEPVTDHLELAIYLYPKGTKPEHRTRLSSPLAMYSKNELDIPPNSITASQGFTLLRSAARIENFQPHMHLRGKAMAMQAILPDGTVEMLSYVDRFDFNWMVNYIYTDDAAPVLPKGAMLRITAWYDNTSANKYNPDPNQWVGYGDRTIEEMGEAFVNITNISDEEYAEWLAKHKPASKTAQ